MKRTVIFIVLLALCTGVSVLGTAQVKSGSVSGTITDSMGASVAGARVTLSYVHSGTRPDETFTTSDGEGHYTFNALREGLYDVWVEKLLFVHETKINISVGSGNTIVDFKLHFAEGCDEASE
jgi:hypothetical protein